MATIGKRYVFYTRMFEVVGETDTAIVYMDNYIDGYSAERRCSKIQWDLDIERGTLVEIEEGK